MSTVNAPYDGPVLDGPALERDVRELLGQVMGFVAVTARAWACLENPSGECEPELRLIEAWAQDMYVEVVKLDTSAEPGSLPADCELVIALGGDRSGPFCARSSSLWRTTRRCSGVNFGNVGFLADSASDDLAAALARIGRGEAQVEERIALAATIQASRHAA